MHNALQVGVIMHGIRNNVIVPISPRDVYLYTTCITYTGYMTSIVTVNNV